jgi:hypothetical protein
MTAPPEEFVPPEARGEPAVALILLHLGDPEDGPDALRPLLELGDPWVTMVQPLPYLAVQQMIDAANPWGISEYFKVDYLRELPDEAIDAAIAKADEIASPFTDLIFAPLGGAMDRVDRAAMALEVPDAKWCCFCLPKWLDPAAAEQEIAWGRGFMAAMRPWTVGKAPPNFIGADESEARLRASYGDAKYERLVALKTEYDPENVFRLNQNIPPRAR